jgi:glycosyltransferase involved in cell wall biosynthesis
MAPTPGSMRALAVPNRRLGPELYEAFARLGHQPGPDGLSSLSDIAKAESAGPPPTVSVVVTTCRNPSMLERCLRSILVCDYEDFEVIVVDNGPPSLDTARMLITHFPGERRLRYVEEPRSSVSLARNTGLARAEAEVVAFTDDDVTVDRFWLRAAVEALLSEGGIACVTGISLPRECESDTRFRLGRQLLLDEGLRRATYRLPDLPRESPVLSVAAGALRSGLGIVMLTEVGRELGGFDPALGPATLSCGGEGLDLLIRLHRSGYGLSYEPRAIVWREHPVQGWPARNVYRHGVGLGATLGKQLIAGPQRRNLLQAIPGGCRDLHEPVGHQDVDEPGRYPRHLRWLRRLGMLVGPIAYLLSALIVRARRLRGRHPSSPRPVRIVRRMVVGGDAVNIVWFEDVLTRRCRFVWRPADELDTQSPSRELVLAAALAIARPATTPAGTLRISVVVPARNAESWIESCLRAIRANGPAEVILVDGDSTDRTVELARPWVDKVISDRGVGVAGARMLGVASASQPWIAFVDADVVLPPSALRDLDQERCDRRLVALQAGLHSVGAGDYWSQSLADHHNRGRSKRWFGVCASLIARDILLAHPLDARLRSGEDIDLRIRLTRAGFRVGVSEAMICQHRFGQGFGFARKQWTADGAGLGRMVRKHGLSALASAMMPFGAAALGILRAVSDTLRPWPYFVGFAIGNYIGLWRGLMDRRVPARGVGRSLVVAGMLGWLLALPVALSAAAGAFALAMIRLGDAAYQGHLLLVTLGILALAIPFEVGRGAGSGHFSALARQLAPFTAFAMALGLILSGLRLAKVVGL